MDLIDIFTKAGPFGLAAVLTYFLKLERAERLESQAEAKQLRKEAESTAWKTSEKLFEQAAATREHLRTHDANIQRLIERVGVR